MTKYKVVGIGNAVVDVITQSTDAFLGEMDIEKGIMQLIEQDRSEALFQTMGERLQTAGGSVANTIAGIGSLGLKTAFIGRVRDDELGQFYAKSMIDEGTDFVNAPAADGNLPTSRCMIFVTPDGERSLNTYLGISTNLGPKDVPDDVASNAEIMFLEGYLFDKDAGKEAFLQASRLTRAAGGKAGIAISDPFCVDRHRADFLRMIGDELDFVMGNEAELKSLFETDDLEEALAKTAAMCPLVVCTRSGDGVTIIRGSERVDVPVTTVVPVDATGAGDQFAAGFIFGMATERDLETCGRMGNICAAEVISHIGPRPEQDMMTLFKTAGLVD
ncbi:MAG: sugar/nucleoside kinase (ribokinase family) [Ascidiaceihabitans sp.]|jgi:sugar/nucleoside kinase (ribokinase family)